MWQNNRENEFIAELSNELPVVNKSHVETYFFATLRFE